MALNDSAQGVIKRGLRAAARSDLQVMITLLRQERSIAYDVKQMLITSGRWPENGVVQKVSDPGSTGSTGTPMKQQVKE